MFCPRGRKLRGSILPPMKTFLPHLKLESAHNEKKNCWSRLWPVMSLIFLFSSRVALGLEQTPGLSTPDYPHLIHTLSTPYPHIIHTLSTLYPHFIHTLSTLYPHLIHTLSTPYPHLIHTLSKPYLHLIQTLSTPYPHLIHT